MEELISFFSLLITSLFQHFARLEQLQKKKSNMKTSQELNRLTFRTLLVFKSTKWAGEILFSFPRTLGTSRQNNGEKQHTKTSMWLSTMWLNSPHPHTHTHTYSLQGYWFVTSSTGVSNTSTPLLTYRSESILSTPPFTIGMKYCDFHYEDCILQRLAFWSPNAKD